VSRTLASLREALRRLDGRGYPSYKQVKGSWDAPSFQLLIDHVQGDPFAEPSRLRALLPASTAQFPGWAVRDDTRRTATADYINRALHDAFTDKMQRRGSGRSGELLVLQPGQQVLVRSSVTVAASGAVELRFRAGLPARGRTILGEEAASLLCDDVAAAIARVCFDALDADALRRHVETVEDARALRAQLDAHGLVAFVADGARLPRRSGIDDRPLDDDGVVPFRAPGSLRVVLHAPNAGDVGGLGIRRGITLLAGGGFHGKSTLLHAIERGAYDHVPGDGRERVVTVADAVKVRAEDGRAVAGADISAFIGRIPGGGDTRAFTTANASGSTSQATAIIEAIEAGTTALLLDEDTSATNFMIRDARMQTLVADEHEPITPYIDRARQLADLGISTVLVLGGSGDYLDVADTIIAMRDFQPHDVSVQARAVIASLPTQRTPAVRPWQQPRARIPLPDSIDASQGRRERHVRVFAAQRVLFGDEEVMLAAVEQLVEPAQARAIAHAIAAARGRTIDARTPLHDVARQVLDQLEQEGLDAFQPEPTGELAAFRAAELIAFLGRLRTLRCTPA